MKQHEIEVAGRIDNEGRLSMYMEELKAFTSKWKDCKVVANFRVYQPGTSAALRGYYYKAVVPTMKRAFWNAGERYTDEQTERILREFSPIMHQQQADPDTGKYNDEIREIKDLDNSELIEHIEIIKQLAAEQFSVYIEDPNTI